VITGGAARRRWSDEAKARIVLESFSEGAVVAQVARRHGLRPQQLFDWRRQFRAQAQGRISRAPEPVAFVPAVVAE
jgi:transposase